MKLHTDKLTARDVYEATAGLDGVFADVKTQGSRARERGLEVTLEGNGYHVNSGRYGPGEHYGATWDEWGVVIARLFAKDPDAFWGSPKYKVYESASDFHFKTNDRFIGSGLPHDTHKRHTWKSVPGPSPCVKCSAVRIHLY